MLVLFETAAGYALFSLLKDKVVAEKGDLIERFRTAEGAQKVVELKAFDEFKDAEDATTAAQALCESSLPDSLSKFLKKSVVKKHLHDDLLVADAKLGQMIKEKLGIPCVYNGAVMELMRGIRLQMDSLIADVETEQMRSMTFGLSHSLSRAKIKFSPEKIDTMVIQAIGLLDELDKELNTYGMRAKEWYSWHFPEVARLSLTNLLYAQVVKRIGHRPNTPNCSFSDLLTPEQERELKDGAAVSMGTEISDDDLESIVFLCDQIISLSEYRAELFTYLQNRMNGIAPNLTTMVGEVVGARLVAHAGSLINLAKYPASTVQILGAEKALFRALKTKRETPKYGIIYHASMIGQAQAKDRGKISRVLAAKTALSARVDALNESSTGSNEFGLEARRSVEHRLQQLEGVAMHSMTKAKPIKGLERYDRSVTETITAQKTSSYNEMADSTMGMTVESDDPIAKAKDEKKAEKKARKRARESATEEGMDVDLIGGKEKKRKKRKVDDDEDDGKSKSMKKSSKKHREKKDS